MGEGQVCPARSDEMNLVARLMELQWQDSSMARKEDVNVLALVKGEERYIFLFDDKNRAEARRTFGKFASDPELSFTWYDAAVLSQRLRQIKPVESQPPKTGSTLQSQRFSGLNVSDYYP